MNRYLIFVLLWVLLALEGVHAEQYALLVGVNRYPNLPAQLQLNGAVNDVRNLAQFLPTSGFQPQHIRVLSDAAPPEQQARRQVILDALQSLSEQVHAGDLVFLYFALHGSQQPVLRSKRQNEADDLDEILLASDVKKWDGRRSTVENAIIDDELDVLFSRMRQRGAFVVAGFDTCHAGTMARGASAGDERDRFVPMRELGIPERLQKPKWRTRGLSVVSIRFPKSNAPTSGGFVGLYASQSDELTKEMKEGEQEWHGVFSHHLLEVLRAFPKISYRQLGEQISARYSEEKRWLSSPQFEGTDLDFQTFSLRPQVSRQQWAILKRERGLIIPAGSLHQFDVGARFSLHRDAVSDQVLGYATVVELHADYSRLEMDKDAQAVNQQDLGQAQFARLKDAKFQQVIRIAIAPNDKIMRAILTRLQQNQQTTGVIWESEGAADYQVLRDARHAQQLCIRKWGANDHCGEDVIQLKMGKNLDESFENLRDAGRKLSMVHRLNRIAMSLMNPSLLDKLDLSLRRADKGNGELLSLNDPKLVLKTGEQFRFSVKNRSHRALDVTVLSLNQEMGIQVLFPEVPGANRIEAEGEQEVLLEVNSRTQGREQIFVFVSEVQPQRASDFGFLEQAEIGKMGKSLLFKDRLRGQALQSLSAMLETERGGAQLPQTAIRRLTWITR